MYFPFCNADLNHLRREAEIAAARLARRFQLPCHERDDLRQELLLDLIARLKSFDPARGSVRGFAGTVAAHQAGRLADRIRRRRSVFAPVSIDDPVHDGECSTLGDTIPESGGYLALHGQSTDRVAEAERRLDLERALSGVASADLRLCAQLTQRGLLELSRQGCGPRASLHRRVQQLRLQLLAAGVAAAA